MGFSYHDNAVSFISTGYLSQHSGFFRVNDFRISSGQDPKGYNHVGDYHYFGSSGDFAIKAGRHGTSDVANFWKGYLNSDENTFNMNPNDLNFAFMGDLMLDLTTRGPEFAGEIQVVFPGVVIAQGHYETQNNWWFGGATCSQPAPRPTGTAPDSVECSGRDQYGQNYVGTFYREKAIGAPPNQAVNQINLLDLKKA